MAIETYYTGGEEYYIIYSKGTHELRRITDDNTSDYEVVFTGFYESCVSEIEKICDENADYDLSL